MTRGLASFVLLACLASRPALAQPMDPSYPEPAAPQREPVERKIGRLVWPVLTAPALVRQGGRLQLLLLRDARGEVPDHRSSWRVSLSEGERGPLWSCPVRAAVRRGNLLELSVEVPVELARDVYDLRVMGPGIDERQPNAVRVHGGEPPGSYRFAVIADHQIWDPSYRLTGREVNGGAYPRRDKEAANLSMARQGLAELALLDPDFVLHLGDLSFGLEYQAEYRQIRGLLEEARLPLFAVPGNHDAYAEYTVHLRGGAATLLAGAALCRQRLGGELSWSRLWQFISCLYGDVKHLLFADLRRDGLLHWRRQLGPPDFGFEHGRLRFVGLNTFAGTPERRHAFSVYLDVLDAKLGIPATDNHGGYLTAAQLTFLRGQARAARDRGQALVVFGHHDPRGNASEGPRYHPNQPFPSDPLALEGFEEWNFDSAAWDSDPHDQRRLETVERNSATELLEVLAEHGGYYLCGHLHRDERQIYEPGSQLGPFTVRRRLEFIRTTSASSSVRGESYWGYRLIEVRGDRLEAVDYAPARGLASLPAGNLWLERPGPTASPAAPGRLLLRSGLPQATRVVASWRLPRRPEGYRFRESRGPGDGPPGGRPARVLEVMLAASQAHYRIELELEAAAFPPPPGKPAGRSLQALPATGNTPPVPRLEVTPAGGPALPPGSSFRTRVGQPLLLSADRSTDPQGDRIVGYFWDLGEGRTARGPRLLHTFAGPGRRRVVVTLLDEAGARSSLGVEVLVEPQPGPGCGGCAGCTAAPAPVEAAASMALPLTLLLLLWGAGRRRNHHGSAGRRRRWRR